jgi:hypothetical protein
VKVQAYKQGDVVRLWCRPFLGEPYSVYAHWDGTEWCLSSGRRVTRKMLDAIDMLPLSFQPVVR